MSMSAAPHRQIFDFIEADAIEIGLQKLQPNADDLNEESLKRELPNSYPDSKIKCFAHIVSEGYCIRANTLSAYCEANRIMLRQMSNSDRKPIKTGTSSNSKSQVDGIIGNVKSIGEKASIKRCVIGNNCTIGDKVKLMNTIVMDNAEIKEGAIIQGSIVCFHAEVGNNAEIKDCIIANHFKVIPLGLSLILNYNSMKIKSMNNLKI